MTEKNAAGRKTDERGDRFEGELIAGIATSREALAQSFAFAQKLVDSPPKGWDWIDATRARDNAVAGGVSILKAMAEVTLATAKLRGEFRNIHNVTRRTEKASEGEGD